MKNKDYLERLLRSYRHYYNVKTENVTEPFTAEAVFQTTQQQYFLTKSARLSESDSNEFVYIALCEHLTAETFNNYDRIAWEDGLERTTPVYGLQNSDVTLYILADTIEENVRPLIKRRKHFKSYRCGIFGMSHYQLVVIESSSEKVLFNRRGTNLKKLVNDILSPKDEIQNEEGNK